MTIPLNTDHVTEALALLLEQYKQSPLFKAQLTSYITQVQELEVAAFDIREKRLLASAVKAQLDDLGVVVRQERVSADDEVYRAFIQARIAINRSNGRTEEIINILRLVSLATDVYHVRDTGHASIVVETFTPQTSAFADLILALVLDAKGGGIKVQVIWSSAEEDDKFQFSSQIGTLETSSTQGYANAAQTTGGKMVGVIE